MPDRRSTEAGEGGGWSGSEMMGGELFLLIRLTTAQLHFLRGYENIRILVVMDWLSRRTRTHLDDGFDDDDDDNQTRCC